MADTFSNQAGFFDGANVRWGLDTITGALLPKGGANDIGSATSPVGTIYGGNQNPGVTANGAKFVEGSVSEEITLDTGGATSDSVANLLPANSQILGIVTRVTAAFLATATPLTFKLGDASTDDRFIDAGAAGTLAATNTATNIYNPAKTAGYTSWQPSAAKIRVTASNTPTAGKIRITVFYRTFTPPTS